MTVTVVQPDTPDLAVGAPSVTDSRPAPGTSFTLSATVRNQGTGSSATTTLRYYRSTDGTIATSDTQVGTDQVVSALAASGTSAESIGLTAPTEEGTYYYGACVVVVSGESDTGNNCSGTVEVTVVNGDPRDYQRLGSVGARGHVRCRVYRYRDRPGWRHGDLVQEGP